MNVSERQAAPIIQLPLFEGPLELLLTLVERRRLPITQVSLATVADQYLGQIRSLPVVDREALADFLVIAAQLLLIKSRALLPPLAPAIDADEDDGDDLVRRLETYRVFKLLSAELGRREATGQGAYSRGALPAGPLPSDAALLASFPAGLLARLLVIVESRARPAAVAPEPVVARISVAARLATLRQRLGRQQTVEWAAVAGETIDETLATLLAVLEMVRRGELSVDQDGLFGPIRLHLLDQPAVAGGGHA